MTVVSSIKVKVVRRLQIKVKSLLRFPANVVAQNFLTITNSGGTYTFGVDYTLLASGPIVDPATSFAVVLDQSTGIYRVVSLASLLASGLVAYTNVSNVFTAGQIINLNAAAAPTPIATTSLQLSAADSVTNRIELDSFGTNSAFSGVRANGTNAVPTTLVLDNEIVALQAHGYDGVLRANSRNAAVRLVAGGTWSGTSHPTYIDFWSTAVGSTTLTSRMRVESDGGITVGGAASQGSGTLNLLSDLFNNGTAPTGTGGYVRATSPVLVTPALGTPASGVATNLTGTAAGLTAGNATLAATVTTNANMTGDVTSVGNATTIGANKVLRSMQAQGVARSVIGVTGNATANVADISGTANQVLRVNGAGTALAFGAIDLSQSAAATGVIQAASFPALTGDITTVSGALATTLATVNANVGTFGSALLDPIITANAKGLITAISTQARREKLAAARTYFVRSDGSDSNTGLVDSAGGAFATFNALWTLITSTLDFGGQTVTIKIGGVTQTITNGLAITSPWTGGGAVVLDGVNGTISSVETCINNTAALPGSFTIQNIILTSSGGGAVKTTGPGTLTIGAGVTFGAVNASFRHMDTQAAGARIEALSAYTITGGGQMHMLATGGGEVKVQGVLATVTGRIIFTYYAYGDRLGFVNASSDTWKGSATFTVTIATPAVVTQTAHGLSVGDPWVPNTSGALPTGLTAGTTYFIIAAGFGANSFEVSTTSGGAAVNTSGTQSGTHNAYSITGQRFNASGLANVFTNGASVNYFPGSTAGVGTNPSASPYGYYN